MATSCEACGRETGIYFFVVPRVRVALICRICFWQVPESQILKQVLDRIAPERSRYERILQDPEA